MDMSFATIPIFNGDEKRLYREVKLQHVVSRNPNAKNHPIYAKDDFFGCFSLSVDPGFENGNVGINIELQTKAQPILEKEADAKWKLYFDGACSKEGAGAGVILISPEGTILPFSHKLDFEATNNVAEYEALVLGLEKARRMNIRNISIYGDSELVIQQINKVYQNKHPRIRSY